VDACHLGTLGSVARRHWLRIALVVLVLGSAIWLFASGAYRQIDGVGLREQLRAAGALGGLAFVMLFAFVQPLGPSGHLFVIGASLIWPGPLAFALSWLGASLGQLNAFFFYRYVAHEWAQARVPPRLRRYERAFVERPFRTVLLLRLMTFTWPLAPAILGVSRVRVRPMAAATALGLMPIIALDVWLGAGVSAWIWARL